MRIADLENMEVNVDVSENNIILVDMNDTAEIDVDAYPDRVFKGIVTEIANSANQSQTGTDQVTNFEVKIRMLQSSYADLVDTAKMNDFPFRPGMSANVDIQTSRVSDAVSIPIQAVIARETDKDDSLNEEAEYKKYVFLYKEKYAMLTEVETGIQDDRYMEIKNGVKQGDEVITAPYKAISEQLKDSTLVQKVEKSELMIFEK
jgi:HlyD family secretion protein